MKSAALTVLELLTFTQTDAQYTEKYIISTVHFVDLAEIINAISAPITTAVIRENQTNSQRLVVDSICQPPPSPKHTQMQSLFLLSAGQNLYTRYHGVLKIVKL